MPDDLNKPVFVLLSLGSNLGNRIENLGKAIQELKNKVFTGDLNISSVYETEPVGVANQPWFLNITVSGLSAIPPQELLKNCKDIESNLGRKERGRWQDREIDIDIILYGESIINTEKLIIPHPAMADRNFVLVPASEIAGDKIHPILNMTINELAVICKDESMVNFSSQGF